MIQCQDLLKLKTGIVFAVPIPVECEANPAVIKSAIDKALAEADE